MEKNQDITVQIEDIGTDGQGIGKYEGMAVFVQGALPAELVDAHIITVKKNYAVGKLLEVKTQSPVRVKPRCRVFQKCGGCTLQHMDYAAQLDYKQARVQGCVARIAKLDVPVLYPLPGTQEYRYRNKASFPVQQCDGKPQVGFYATHSHRVVDVDDCKIQPAEFALALNQLRVWLVKYNISIYDEATHAGLLRHIVFRTNTAGEIMLVLVINGEELPYTRELLALFKFVLPQIKSILVNFNTQNTNVIFGEKSSVLLGRDHFYETVGGLEFQIGARSFLQVNTPQAEVLYRNLVRMLQPKKTDVVVDLYSGAGTITLIMARLVKQAYGIELLEEAVENAAFNARLNEIENAAFFEGDALHMLPQVKQQAGRVDIITVDPPRKGLNEPLIRAMVEIAPHKIGYVSCDPATLARDLALFAQLGYHAGAIQPVDLFPQTTHVECLTVLTKADG